MPEKEDPLESDKRNLITKHKPEKVQENKIEEVL